jgi:hypothetical protein
VYRGDLTFATVRGAGHQVPTYQPLRALSLTKHFPRMAHLFPILQDIKLISYKYETIEAI